MTDRPSFRTFVMSRGQNSAKDKRRLQLVDRAVQGALAWRLTAHWLLFVALAAGLTVVMTALSDPFRPLSWHVSAAWRTYGPLLLVLGALVPVFVWDSVKLSNRFAGPMVRFRRTTRELAAGEVPPRLKLRPGDFWGDYADDLNAVIARVAAERSVRERGERAAWAVAEQVADAARRADADAADRVEPVHSPSAAPSSAR